MRRRHHPLVVAGVALVARLLVVLWAAHAIPPTADGTYYEKLAERLAAGQGYTWLWPDGAVTYAAHYPVGYPALLAVGYALFGVTPVLAMLVNAGIGTAGAVAAWSLVARASSTSRGNLALGAGIAVALHPVLVPYTAAIMTEGVTASFLVIAAALAAEARRRESWHWLVAMGLVLGVTTLVRPQSLVFAPLFGLLALRRATSVQRALAGGLALAVALAVCAPWTVRNCRRMERCALVSVNGGWNLAIGAQTKSGSWQEISVPEPCKEVFQEAAKDRCFGKEAEKVILAHPLVWIARMPAKLRATFDYFGAAPWYLNTASPEAFPYRAKVALAGLETLVSRLLLAAALVSIWRWPGERRRARRVVVAVGLMACILVPGTVGYLALAVGIALAGRKLPLVMSTSAVVILATAAIHAVFFGAGRYGIVVVPFVTCLAFVRAPQTR